MGEIDAYKLIGAVPERLAANRCNGLSIQLGGNVQMQIDGVAVCRKPQRLLLRGEPGGMVSGASAELPSPPSGTAAAMVGVRAEASTSSSKKEKNRCFNNEILPFPIGRILLVNFKNTNSGTNISKSGTNFH